MEVRVYIGRVGREAREDFTGLKHLGNKGTRLSGYSLITEEVVEVWSSREETLNPELYGGDKSGMY